MSGLGALIKGITKLETLIVTNAVALPVGSLSPAAVAVDPTAPMAAEKSEQQFTKTFLLGTPQARHVLSGQENDIDNGAGTTVDQLLFVPLRDIRPLAAAIAYSGATTGTVAAGNMKIGTAVGGAQIVAATAYENTKAVGTITAMALASTAVIPAGTPIWIRHTGVAATQAGLARVIFEFCYVDDEYVTGSVVAHVAHAAGEVLAAYAMHDEPSDGDQALSIDVVKGNAADAYATVLTGAMALNSTIAAREVVEGTPAAAAAYEAGDIIRIDATKSGSTGENGKRASVTLVFREFPE